MVYLLNSNNQQEVVDHAMTVAKDIYGELADEYLLSVYRTDGDNDVAAGKGFMKHCIQNLRAGIYVKVWGGFQEATPIRKEVDDAV